MFIEFVVSILGISFLFGFSAMFLWKKDTPQWQGFLFFYTFLPAVISIIVMFVLRNELSVGDFSFKKFDLLYLGLGVLIPVVYYVINLSVQLLAATYAIKGGIEWKKVIPVVLANLVVLIVFVSGEEIGWRGFIQNRSIERYGSVLGIIVLGSIWGIWHAPIALRGHNLKSHFWMEAFVLYPYVCICYSFPLAFLTIQSGSIWPAVLFHATNNALGSLTLQVVEKKNPVREAVLLMLTGTLLVVPSVFLIP